GLQGGRQFVQVAGQHRRQLARGEADAVVGDARLREVVGADALRALAAADLHQARLARSAGRLGTLALQEPRAQHRQGALLVLDLRLAVLAGDDDLVLLARVVGDAHRRVGGVHRLPAGAARAVDVDAVV